VGLLAALDIGRSGLLAQQLGLTVTGNNIANVNTPGYTRQRVDLGAVPPALQNGVLVGRGVRALSVQQILDPLVDRRLRNAITDAGEDNLRRDLLSDVSALLNDLTEPSLGTALDGFFDAADGLARNPGGLAERQTLLGAAGGLADELNRRATGLATLQRGADDRLLGLVAEGNDELSQIATLNTQIAAAEVTGQSANELRDQRETALQSLGRKVGITSVEAPNGGLRVSLLNGPVLVENGTVTNALATQTTAPGLDGGFLHEVGLAGPGGFISTPASFQTGEFAALIETRDGAIPTASANLDTFAATLASSVNAVQQNAAARDLDGLSTAAVPFFSGTTAESLSVAITDPRRIAAARSTQPGDNQNALALADLRTAPQAGLGGVSPSGYLASEVARVGQAAAQADDVAAASDHVFNQVQAQRDSISGVNLNEELTNLLRYQYAFQAAARVINVADTVLGELVNLVR
jgi:flagellar hook-associated protein 1